jgi:hypothetical protein
MPSWKLFSADDHVDLQYLPGDMWVKRVPQKYRDRVPRLIETKDGWHFEADGKIFGSTTNMMNSLAPSSGNRLAR